MTKPAFCKKHNVQSFVQTSPRLAEAIENNEYLSTDKIVTLKILSYGKIFEYKIDIAFVNELDIIPVDGEVMLRDRDKKEKKMNDRLIIQKITREMKWVCPICLSEIFTKSEEGQIGDR
jgi:hypothetical protein